MGRPRSSRVGTSPSRSPEGSPSNCSAARLSGVSHVTVSGPCTDTETTQTRGDPGLRKGRSTFQDRGHNPGCSGRWGSRGPGQHHRHLAPISSELRVSRDSQSCPGRGLVSTLEESQLLWGALSWPTQEKTARGWLGVEDGDRKGGGHTLGVAGALVVTLWGTVQAIGSLGTGWPGQAGLRVTVAEKGAGVRGASRKGRGTGNRDAQPWMEPLDLRTDWTLEEALGLEPKTPPALPQNTPGWGEHPLWGPCWGVSGTLSLAYPMS
jgi:hypothetical protein